MNFTKLKLGVASGAALGVGGALLAIGLGLLFYALLKIWLVPPVAGGLSFLTFGAVAVIAGLVIKGGADAPRRRHEAEAAVSGHSSSLAGLPERALEIARSKPVLALVGAGLAAAVVLRHPVILSAVIGAVLNRGHHGGRRFF